MTEFGSVAELEPQSPPPPLGAGGGAGKDGVKRAVRGRLQSGSRRGGLGLGW